MTYNQRLSTAVGSRLFSALTRSMQMLPSSASAPGSVFERAFAGKPKGLNIDPLRTKVLAAAVVAFVGVNAPVFGADLTFALKGPNESADPHYMTSPAAWQVNAHIFEPLLWTDENGKVIPGLAASWEQKDPTTLIFNLQRNVRWHDGAPFTAKDVVFTYGRAGQVPNAPTSFATYLNQIDKVEAIDDYTVRVTTSSPAPALLQNLSYVLIVSERHGKGGTTEQYNSNQVAIGTGPYKLVNFTQNVSTILTRNDDYWGGKPRWDKVTFRVVSSDPSRVAALLAGDVDIIESVPTQDLARLSASDSVNIVTRPTGRIVYLAFDTGAEALTTGKVTGPNGEKLDRNPLADLRVRRALKLSLDTAAFISRIYQGQAISTGQFLPLSSPGADQSIGPWKPDLEAARKLIAESGWQGKFKLNISVASTVFQNAVQVAEAMAQSWTRIGIPTQVTTFPSTVFNSTRNNRELPIYVQSYQNLFQSAEFSYPTMLHTRDAKERRYGALNYSRYSNHKLDVLIEEAMSTIDDRKRAEIFIAATKIAIDDSQVIPLWLLSEATGTRKNISFAARGDRLLLAENASLK